jgi:hypothetical protein
MSDPLLETDKLPTPTVPSSPKMSATAALAASIELMTGATWTQEQRSAVSDVIRAYRFEQVGAIMARIHNLVKQKGSKELSEMIFFGKF